MNWSAKSQSFLSLPISGELIGHGGIATVHLYPLVSAHGDNLGDLRCHWEKNTFNSFLTSLHNESRTQRNSQSGE